MISPKFGGSNYVKPRSNLNDPIWTSTARLSYKSPVARNRPTQRARSSTPGVMGVSNLLFDRSMQNNNKPKTKASGYVGNTNLFYGINWAKHTK